MKCAYGKNKRVMDKSRNKRRFLHCWLFRNTVNHLIRSRIKYPEHTTTVASIRLGLLKVDTPDLWPLNFGNLDWKPESVQTAISVKKNEDGSWPQVTSVRIGNGDHQPKVTNEHVQTVRYEPPVQIDTPNQ